MKNFLTPLFCVSLVFGGAFQAHAKSSPFVGTWNCQLHEKGKAFGKVVVQKIRKKSEIEYVSQVASNPETLYVIKNDILRDAKKPKFGLKIIDGKLTGVDIKEGKAFVKDFHVACTKAN